MRRALGLLFGRPRRGPETALAAAAGDASELAAVAAALDAAVAHEDGAPAWIQLMPAGEIRTRPHDGRPSWHLRDPAGVVAASRAGLPIAIDYEHQTEHARLNGQAAPAAGWIEDIEARADGLYGKVAWTEKAGAMVRGREYRFLSPVFRYDPKTREVKRIIMAGLTNDRAFADLKAFAKSEGSMENLIKKLRHLFGLAEDADELAIASAAEAVTGLLGRVVAALGLKADAKPEEIEAAAKAQGDRVGGASLAAIAQSLDLEAGADAPAVAAAAARLKAAAEANAPDPAGYVTMDEYNKVVRKNGELEEKAAGAKAETAVDDAMVEGKLFPAQREWALAYAKRDLEGFIAFLLKQPRILKPGRSLEERAAARADRPLGAGELAIAKAMGISEEDWRKSAKALEGQAEETF